MHSRHMCALFNVSFIRGVVTIKCFSNIDATENNHIIINFKGGCIRCAEVARKKMGKAINNHDAVVVFVSSMSGVNNFIVFWLGNWHMVLV